MKPRYLIPLVLICSVLIILWRGLSMHPSALPSQLIGKPAPNFSLPELGNPDRHLTQKILQGQVSLLNVWSVTCSACIAEHPFLMSLTGDTRFNLIGMNYRDTPASARQWLAVQGNPYSVVLTDLTGDAAIDWGVYGTPETFIVDKHGDIRYRQLGAMNADIWNTTLSPLITLLASE